MVRSTARLVHVFDGFVHVLMVVFLRHVFGHVFSGVAAHTLFVDQVFHGMVIGQLFCNCFGFRLVDLFAKHLFFDGRQWSDRQVSHELVVRHAWHAHDLTQLALVELGLFDAAQAL